MDECSRLQVICMWEREVVLFFMEHSDLYTVKEEGRCVVVENFV